MKKTLLASFFFTAFTALSLGQARLVMNNNIWMVIDNGAWVVVENPATNAITTMGNGGNILSEGEADRVRWQIGTTVAPGYIVPFTTPAGTKIPLTYNKTTAGAGGATASVVFSTYRYDGIPQPPGLPAAPGSEWRNFDYRPSDVTHMNNYVTGMLPTPVPTPDESGHVVDRFWIIDTKAAGYNYTTNPDASMLFLYPDVEVTGGNFIGGNTPLDPQRFNSTLNKWGDVLFPSPLSTWTDLVALNSVQTPVITSAQFFRSWTLSDRNNPLPIELTDFRARCENDQVVISWTTATEHDNDYFTIEKSGNAVDWYSIGEVQGAGTSIETIHYNFVDPTPTGMAYYRLVQTDIDGGSSTSGMVAAGCEAGGGIEIVNAWDDGSDLNVVVSSSFEAVMDLTVMDVQGKVMVMQPNKAIAMGITHLPVDKGLLATGVYLVRLSNSETVMSRRIVLN